MSTSFANLRFASLAILLALAGCGGSPVHTSGPPARAEIDRVRAEAAAHPDDPASQRTLAMWELLGDGGDPECAAEAIARAEALAPEDVGLVYLRGVLAEQRGRPDEALDAFIAVMERAPRSADPLAPFYAESTLAFLEDVSTNATRYQERARPAMESVFVEPGALGLPIRRRVGFWLRERALERGDAVEASRVAHALGCPDSVRVAGPFGFAVLSPFDRTLPAEGRGPMAARYDLGPGRGEVETRTVEARDCEAVLGIAAGDGAGTGAGTRVVEATLRAESAGRHVLALVTDASVQISIDGQLVGRVDRRRVLGGSTSYHEVELSAGEHELELKLTSRQLTPSVGWTLDRARDGYDPAVGARVPLSEDEPLARFATLDVLALRGETVEARERLRGALSERAGAALLSLGARITSSDPFVPDTRSDDDERRLVGWAAARDPQAYWPALRRANLETGELEALAALRDVAARFPALASIQLDLSDALSEAGYDAEADEALERAVQARPDACRVIAARFQALIGRNRITQATPLARALVACDARDGVVFEMALSAHDWTTARGELARLAPLLTPIRLRAMALRVARASGESAEEARLIGEIEAERDDAANTLVEADRRYAAGERDAALALVRAETARAPHRSRGLRVLERALSERDVMEPYRVDGLDVIRRFEASGRSYEGQAAVLVFDYMVTRVFPDGSAIDLVHQVYRLQTAEGVEQFAELQLGGRVLTVRAVSSDGRTREPDESSGSIDMPPLAVGDYVEYEILRDHAPQWGDGFVSPGWVFQNFAQPFDHSEMVFVAPADMTLRFDARGTVPPPETHEEDGLRVYRFLMSEQRPLTREPHSLADPPILPSLRAGTRVTWDRMFEAVHDRLLDVDHEDPAASRVLREEILGGDELSPRARAQRIHHWVIDNVEEANDSFFGSAPFMLAARQGNRTRVIRYLLELAGIPARIAFSRSLAGDRPNADVPDTGVFGEIVIVAEPEPGAPLYLVASGRGVPHDFFPPSLRGQDAVVIAEGLPRITLPATQGADAALRFSSDIELDSSGRARLHLTITFVGAAAAEVREAIREVPPAERARVVAERFAPSIVPGAIADPATLAMRGLDDWESDLEIELDAESAGIVRGSREGIVLLPLFASGIEADFARLPARSTTELVGEVDVQVSLRVRGPGVSHAPQSARLVGPAGALAELDARRDQDGTVHLTRHVRVPLSAISIADYEGFARFCRATTQLENATVVFTPR